MARLENPSGEPVNHVRASHLVDELSAALREGELGLKTVPGLMRAVLREGAWRERQIRTGKVVKFERFVEFITGPPLAGLGERPEMIKRLLHEDPETLAMFEGAMVAGNQGRRNDLVGDSNQVAAVKNGKGYQLRRLEKSSPELFAEVVAGTLTANQAAIKAGFRKVKGPLDQLKAWWEKASFEERKDFIAFAAQSP